MKFSKKSRYAAELTCVEEHNLPTLAEDIAPQALTDWENLTDHLTLFVLTFTQLMDFWSPHETRILPEVKIAPLLF